MVKSSILPTLVLDGSAQFAVLALVLAVVAYLRNIPMRELKDAMKKYTSTLPVDSDDRKQKMDKLKWIFPQLVVLDIVQISLAVLAVFIAGRTIIWGPKFDSVILWAIFMLAVIFLIFHLCTDIRDIKRTAYAWGNPWKQPVETVESAKTSGNPKGYFLLAVALGYLLIKLAKTSGSLKGYLAKPETAGQAVKSKKHYYDELLKEGFTREEALQVLVSTKF